MQFVLMIYDNEQANAAQTPSASARTLEGYMAFGRELQAAGKFVAANRLRYGREASTVRQRGGARMVVDGPFAESKEVLGGYYVIEAESMAEAVEWAKKLPLVDAGGGVEVRPVWTMS